MAERPKDCAKDGCDWSMDRDRCGWTCVVPGKERRRGLSRGDAA